MHFQEATFTLDSAEACDNAIAALWQRGLYARRDDAKVVSVLAKVSDMAIARQLLNPPAAEPATDATPAAEPATQGGEVVAE